MDNKTQRILHKKSVKYLGINLDERLHHKNPCGYIVDESH